MFSIALSIRTGTHRRQAASWSRDENLLTRSWSGTVDEGSDRSRSAGRLWRGYGSSWSGSYGRSGYETSSQSGDVDGSAGGSF